MILGIHGKMGSGKSLCSKMITSILEDNNINSEIKSFAKPIYEVIGAIFQMGVEEIKQNKNTMVKPRSFMGMKTYRELLQTIGMELRDSVDEDIWIDALFGKHNSKVLNDWTSHGCNWWVIDDLRFINEFYRIRSSGGKLIKIVRKQNTNIHPDILNNGSEINLDKFDDDQWDHIVDNNYSKDITKKSLENFIMTILQREQ